MSRYSIIFLVLSFFICGRVLADTKDVCISKKDVEDVAKSFHQFKRYAPEGPTLCSDSGAISDAWFKLLLAAVDIKKLDHSKLPEVSIEDDFTFEAVDISQYGGYWNFLTSRSFEFVLSDSDCDENSGACVKWNGKIYFTNDFFKADRVQRMIGLLHEIRHLDGFKHIKCENGMHKGRSVCDKSLSQGGPYGFGIQIAALVGSSKYFSKEERSGARFLAVYYLRNHINSETTITYESKLILSNTKGEVFEWKENRDLKLLVKLSDASRAYLTDGSLISFPLDVNKNPIKLSAPSFEKTEENIGVYAKKYIELNQKEREHLFSLAYESYTVSYRDLKVDSGLLVDGFLYFLCPLTNRFYDISKDIWPEKLISLNQLSPNLNFRGKLYAKGISGKLYRVSCDNKRPTISPTSEFVSEEIVSITHLNNQNYGLDQSGSLVQVERVDGNFIAGPKVSFDNQLGPWVSVSKSTDLSFAISAEKQLEN